MLYCENDHWAPSHHLNEIAKLQSLGVIPAQSIRYDVLPGLKHDFVSANKMIPPVVRWCMKQIRLQCADQGRNTKAATRVASATLGMEEQPISRL
mmetsp:Transcript_72/g.187  ORF Transcript_72/g.187 Transcript_72/m.187 type:complete len:95 (+) Transcript_72:114-398(+)